MRFYVSLLIPFLPVKPVAGRDPMSCTKGFNRFTIGGLLSYEGKHVLLLIDL